MKKLLGELVIIFIVALVVNVVTHALCYYFDATSYFTGYWVGYLTSLSVCVLMSYFEQSNEKL